MRVQDRPLALKRLDTAAPDVVVELFEQESRVLATLRHPRVVRVHDLGVSAQGPYYTNVEDTFEGVAEATR